MAHMPKASPQSARWLAREASGVRRIPPLSALSLGLLSSAVADSKAREDRALQRLRQSAFTREAFGVRRIPPLLDCICTCFSLNAANLSTVNPNQAEPLSHSFPNSIRTLSLPPGRSVGLSTKLPPKDWPHAPVHRLSENAVYIVTAGTLNKNHLFTTDAKRDLLERMLLSLSKQHGWQLEAWAVMANHYHFVARGNQHSTNLREFLQKFHCDSACGVNEADGQPGRKVWYNFYDTQINSSV